MTSSARHSKAAIGQLPVDERLSMTDDLFGSQRFRSLLAAHDNHTGTIAVFQAAIDRDLAAEQVKLAEYQQRLQTPADVVVIDLMPPGQP